MSRSIAMTGCFCPNCKEYVFYKMRNGDDVLFDNLSTTRFIRHICGNETTLQMQATQIIPTEGEPTCAADYNNRGMWQAEREYYDIAISEYNIAIRLSPNDATLYNNRGRAKAALCRQYPERPLAYYYRGKAKIELEQIDAAKEDLYTALKFVSNVGDDVKLKNKIEIKIKNALRLINTRN